MSSDGERFVRFPATSLTQTETQATTIDQFNALGYEYGDSVNVTFSNGYTLEDIPYYNGYYTATGEPLLIAYPGYDYIKAAINNSADLWLVADLDEDDTADIELNERGKYERSRTPAISVTRTKGSCSRRTRCLPISEALKPET